MSNIDKFVENGLTIIFKENKKIPIVSLKLFIKIGSLYEPNQIKGITNLLQASIIKGTKSKNAEEIALGIESYGGSISTTANEDYSIISVDIQSKYFEKAIELLFEILLSPTFPEPEIEKEKFTILAYLKNRQDYIFNVACDLLFENLYGEHPYSTIVAGKGETVEKIKRKDVVDWHWKYYGSPNLILSVCGDLSYKTLDKEINKFLKNIPKVKSVDKIQKTIKFINNEIKKPTKFQQAYIMLGFLGPNAANYDSIVLRLIDGHFGGGMNSRLFQYLREEVGFAYEVNSFFPLRLDKSHFVIYIGLDKKNIDEAKRRIQKIIDEVKKEGIKEERLKEIKRHLRGLYLMDHETFSRQAWYLGFWEILGKGYRYDEKYIDELESVNREETKRVAEKYFVKENSVIVELTPKSLF